MMISVLLKITISFFFLLQLKRDLSMKSRFGLSKMRMLQSIKGNSPHDFETTSDFEVL